MPVNRISLAISQAQRQAALDAVGQAWTALPGLIALEPGELKELHPFINKRELLGRGVLDAFEAHPQMAPASLNVAGARADLDALDTLRPILAEVRRLHSMLEDTVALLGHAIPFGVQDAPHTTAGLVALAGMAFLYACLAAMQARPQALATWRRWSYAGFYVDEYATRAALRWWPARWMPAAND